MDFVLTLHSHLPWVLNHGRWPHGSDWLCEAMADTYLPLVETLDGLAHEGIAAPITVGVTPVLAAQLCHPSLGPEMDAFFAQRLEACDEAEQGFSLSGEQHLTPLARFWRERYARLRRLLTRTSGGVAGALRRHADAGRIELLSSAATHGFLPLLGREESIALQLAVGRAEHRRIFGREPEGCWLPECAYRPRGDWHHDPGSPPQRDRPGVEEQLAAQGYRFFFVDSHLAAAGRPLGLYRDAGWPERSWRGTGAAITERPADEAPDDATALRSPYRTYQVSPRAGRRTVTALIRDPESTRQVWSRHGGFPGDGSYLEFHKIRYPGGLKFWRVTRPDSDLGLKEPYEPNAARARAFGHAAHLHWMLARRAGFGSPDAGESVIVAPFDTELFGHWWFEGVSFLGDLYRRLSIWGGPTPRTASAHLAATPPTRAVALAPGSWGANGDFSMWLNAGTRWTWEQLWSLERRFWDAAPAAISDPGRHPVLAQAARELLLLQASDWQFIISTGAAADYGARRFRGHADDLEALLGALEPGGEGRLPAAADLAERVRARDDLFPDVLPALAAVLGR
ncbi:MAG TPA: 1,4-alpha-glucan branching protein domain-containing protein [Gemmatimonadales bacterium]|nr:1,4-alpha-glucan branching protein domain-containing protein [Gemmatimonadales bacterium]